MTSYRVAIPSYRRPETIRLTTLPLLADGGVPLDVVDVWVADEEDEAAYRASLDGIPVTIRCHGRGQGVLHARNAIATGYPEGTRLVQIDDDVRRIVEAVSTTELADVLDVAALFEYAFDRADEERVSLWCLYPAANPYFMKDREIVGLLYAEACVIGSTLRRDDAELVTVDDKEDFERSIKAFIRDGGVLRLDHFSFVSRFYTEPGGMQTYRTRETIETGARILVDRYPELATFRVSKGRGQPEVRLRRLDWRTVRTGGRP